MQVDAELAQSRTAHEVGSTAVVALLGATHLWVANCGEMHQHDVAHTSLQVQCLSIVQLAFIADYKAGVWLMAGIYHLKHLYQNIELYLHRL